jgi:ketosteroid isomerase-like protein
MMSEHPNVTTVNRMTKAIFDEDHATLASLFADDLQFHLRGPFERAGDHVGVDGLLDALGRIFEVTNGDIRLDQLFCVGTDDWAAEWERSVLGRNGRTLESDNAFIYRFDAGRIAEMWMFLGAPPDRAGAFFA